MLILVRNLECVRSTTHMSRLVLNRARPPCSQVPLSNPKRFQYRVGVPKFRALRLHDKSRLSSYQADFLRVHSGTTSDVCTRDCGGKTIQSRKPNSMTVYSSIMLHFVARPAIMLRRASASMECVHGAMKANQGAWNDKNPET